MLPSGQYYASYQPRREQNRLLGKDIFSSESSPRPNRGRLDQRTMRTSARTGRPNFDGKTRKPKISDEYSESSTFLSARAAASNALYPTKDPSVVTVRSGDRYTNTTTSRENPRARAHHSSLPHSALYNPNEPVADYDSEGDEDEEYDRLTNEDRYAPLARDRAVHFSYENRSSSTSQSKDDRDRDFSCNSSSSTPESSLSDQRGFITVGIRNEDWVAFQQWRKEEKRTL